MVTHFQRKHLSKIYGTGRNKSRNHEDGYRKKQKQRQFKRAASSTLQDIPQMFKKISKQGIDSPAWSELYRVTIDCNMMQNRALGTIKVTCIVESVIQQDIKIMKFHYHYHFNHLQRSNLVPSKLLVRVCGIWLSCSYYTTPCTCHWLTQE